MDDNEIMQGDIVPGDNGFLVTSVKGIEYFIDGVNYRLLKNGAIFDCKATKIVAATDKALHFKNKESAREASLKGWQEYRAAAAEGLAAAGGNKMAGGPGVWGQVVKAQAELAMSKDGMASVVAARFVGNAVGALDDKGKLPSGDNSSDLVGQLAALGVERLGFIIEMSQKVDNDGAND